MSWQMDSNPECEILQKVLTCFKINRPAGIALSLVDSGSTCFLNPLDENLIVRYACATPITGTGNFTAKNYSPMIMGAVTSETGQYHFMQYPRIYEMNERARSFFESALYSPSLSWMKGHLLKHDHSHSFGERLCNSPLGPKATDVTILLPFPQIFSHVSYVMALSS